MQNVLEITHMWWHFKNQICLRKKLETVVKGHQENGANHYQFNNGKVSL